MHDVICQAIREKRLLELHSDGHVLRVAPHIYGIEKKFSRQDRHERQEEKMERKLFLQGS